MCSLSLLQVTAPLPRTGGPGPAYVGRADEIFRLFKQAAVEHYRTHHDAAFYADRLNISTTYLSRIVKRVTGHTVYTHLAELLCADARRYLECTDLDIREIADRLGFSDQSAFGKFFRARNGLSPTRYRSQAGRR